MFRFMARPLTGVVAVLSLTGFLPLAGCGVHGDDLASAVPTPMAAMHGSVLGGVYPIQYATVRLMETQNNGYGGAAKQLAVTTSDNLGNFNFSNSVTCDPGQYVYMTVSSGQTISGSVNNDVVQVGVIGSCSVDLVNPQNVNVYLSELSTVAAAYALGNFITISPNDSSGAQIVNISAPANNNSTSPGCTTNAQGTMSCQASGLANGFANAYHLVDSVRYDGSFPTGLANTTFQNGANSKAIVPQALIHALGNILQSCVDSAGGTGVPCTSLFQAATPPGGTAPKNTLQVAMNMAKYPTNHADTLFNLQGKTVPFTPSLTLDTIGASGPTMSLAISIFYTGTGLATDPGLPYPIDVALDSQDNAYVLYSKDKTGTSYTALDGFGPDGTGLFAGTRLTTLPNPAGIALDSQGNAWVTNDTASGGLSALYTSGSKVGTVSQAFNVPNDYPAGVAVDASDSVWVSRDSADGNTSLFRYASNNGYARSLTLFAPVLRASAKHIAVDPNGNVWGVTSSTTSTASAFYFPYGTASLLAAVQTATLGATGGMSVAVSSNGEAYFPLNNELSSSSASGALLANVTANTAGSITFSSGSAVPMGSAIDGSGKIFWTDFESAGQVYMTVPTTGSGTPTSATLAKTSTIAFQPCFIVSLQCHVSTSGNYLRGMAIDSSGAMWYVADSSDYAVVQTLGLASPTWPLLSYAHAGSPVQ